MYQCDGALRGQWVALATFGYATVGAAFVVFMAFVAFVAVITCVAFLCSATVRPVARYFVHLFFVWIPDSADKKRGTHRFRGLVPAGITSEN